MPEQVILSPEVLDVVMPLTSIILSGIISWIISKSTAIKELRQMQLTWTREDVISLNEHYTKMIYAVQRFLNNPTPEHKGNALEEIAVLREKESGDLAYLLDDLSGFIQLNKVEKTTDRFNHIISKRRQIRSWVGKHISKRIKDT